MSIFRCVAEGVAKVSIRLSSAHVLPARVRVLGGKCEISIIYPGPDRP